MTTATLTATETALSIIRDESLSVDDVAQRFGCSDMFAAGMIDAVTGAGEFIGCIDWCEQDPGAREEYQDGFCHGQALVDAENEAAGWDEAYALAAVEAAQPTFAPCLANDMPF
jgi:hypothetical protein